MANRAGAGKHSGRWCGTVVATDAKELLAKQMMQSQTAEAQKLSREYWTRYVIPFQ